MNNEINEIIKNVYESKAPRVALGGIADIQSGGTPSTRTSEYWENGKINWATLVDTKNKYLHNTAKKITETGMKNSSATLLPVNTVLFSSRATIGDISIAKVETCTNQGYKNFICDETKIHHEYLYYVLKHETENFLKLSTGMTYPEISKTVLSNYLIPLPPIKRQHAIIAQIAIKEKQIAEYRQKIESAAANKAEILENYL